MIGKLKGLIDSYGEDFVILDVGGVGYQVHCSTRTLQALPAPGEAAVLSIETYVREDQIKLFGFRSDAEREWFRLLQTVQGVGAKVALAVLSTLPPSDLANAIALRDKGLKFVAEQVANALDPKPTAEFREMVELALMTTVAAAFGYAATKVSLASSIGQPVSPVLDQLGGQREGG